MTDFRGNKYKTQCNRIANFSLGSGVKYGLQIFVPFVEFTVHNWKIEKRINISLSS